MHTNADKYADMAEAASARAQAALARAMQANIDAMAAAMAAMSAETSADAKVEQGKAEAANGIATEAHTGDTGAGMAYMDAKAAAEKASSASADHVLELFKSANAYDLTSDTAVKAEIASVGAAIRASAMAEDGAQAGEAGATAAWVADTADDPTTRADESAEGMLIITFDPDDTGADNVVSDTTGDADADPVVTPNAKMIAGVDGFMHGFDISERGDDGNIRVIAFTNKVQNTPAIAETPVTVTESARGSRITGLGTAATDNALNRTGVTYDHDDNPDTTALTGTLTCGTGCSLSSTGTGDSLEVTISGYTFSGTATIAAVDEASEDDYLIFGLWLDEATDDGADTFGAFADGGEAFTAGNVNALTGEAEYSGPAVGAHHKTGEGVSFFDADASLTAKFGTDAVAGTIEGSISNISVDGGPAMSQSIILVMSTVDDGTNTFDGTAVMGAQTSPGSGMHTYNGTWSGGYYGDGMRATDHPNSVAGTFGVQRHETMDTTDTTDDIYESFVGAFAAEKD